jgi:hypothetical protein
MSVALLKTFGSTILSENRYPLFEIVLREGVPGRAAVSLI